jgi:hypothetical protein
MGINNTHYQYIMRIEKCQEGKSMRCAEGKRRCHQRDIKLYTCPARLGMVSQLYLRVTIERPPLLRPGNHASIVRGIPASAGVSAAP